MRFVMMVIPKGCESASPGTLPDAKLVETMTRYNNAMLEAGVMLSGEGLHPWIIQAKSNAEAIRR